MSSNKTSLKSNPLFRRQQRRHIYNNTMSPSPSYPRNRYEDEKSGNNTSRNNRRKTKYNARLNRTGSIKRRNSYSGNISLAERLTNYQNETKKQIDKTDNRSGYQEKVRINELIQTIGNKLANKPKPVIKLKHREEPLRVIATPERAKEIVRRYFDNPNPKPMRKNPTPHSIGNRHVK